VFREIIGPLVKKWNTKGLTAFNPHDRRSRQGDAGPVRSRSWLRSKASAPGGGAAINGGWPSDLRLAAYPVPRSHSCSTRWDWAGLRQWAGLRDPAAASLGKIARLLPSLLYNRPLHDRGKRARRWGFFSRIVTNPEQVLSQAQTSGQADSRKGRPSPNTMDQADAGDGMGDVGGRGDRGRGRSPRRCA